jgi:hypothetical protein
LAEFGASPGVDYYAAVYRYSGPKARFDVFLPDAIVTNPLADHSIVVPAVLPDVVTVGAVPYGSPGSVQPYSSRGPTVAGDVKPNVVAPDEVSSRTYETFAGTSAASPHVAGMAALMLSAVPGASPGQVQQMLEAAADPLSATVPHYTWGYGLAQMGDLPETIPMSVTAIRIVFKTTVGKVVVKVRVQDDQGNWVPGATVTGRFIVDGTRGKRTGVTNDNGWAILRRGKLTGGEAVRFCVLDTTGAGFVYDPSGNSVSCVEGVYPSSG